VKTIIIYLLFAFSFFLILAFSLQAQTFRQESASVRPFHWQAEKAPSEPYWLFATGYGSDFFDFFHAGDAYEFVTAGLFKDVNPEKTGADFVGYAFVKDGYNGVQYDGALGLSLAGEKMAFAVFASPLAFLAHSSRGKFKPQSDLRLAARTRVGLQGYAYEESFSLKGENEVLTRQEAVRPSWQADLEIGKGILAGKIIVFLVGHYEFFALGDGFNSGLGLHLNCRLAF